jgi:peptidoglycan hydrolase-like protein with peptidoglycan-binding domain
MRRVVAVVALGLLAFAPAARAAAPCGVTATPVTGPAPLAVTFNATCDSAAYSWTFGDGQTGEGQTVQHVFAAGAWRPSLVTDGGEQAVPAVTAVSVRIAGPHAAPYAHWVTLRATVTPRVPVTLRGRRFVGGKLRVRVLGTRAWVAEALGVRSAPLQILVTPKLVLRLRGSAVVGGRLRVVATLHPASAGVVVAPRSIDTRTARVARVVASSRPAAGWQAVRATAVVSIAQPRLSLGARGPSVRELERRLAELRYAVRAGGFFGDDDLDAVYAFQKVERLPRTGSVDASLWRRLRSARTPRARYGGNHVEIDKTRQVLLVVRGGKVDLVVPTSTGATGNTPVGLWHVYRKVAGYDWVLYYPSYFLRGFAIHGYPDVPPYPASHGCARIPMWIAQTVYGKLGYGSDVWVYA